ncbi:hypothetical protein [Xanthovirga aplysinae]|uniref:hypothetical protein n=1 Tax=Xanthovirga aplysinae TaxID=2529853 RepID=UPI0012BCA631|nr:hypothetical protein [Xanthovirga aplysinae]MTI31521.1 hypothetical protein [Xanthovirga aplysinae]
MTTGCVKVNYKGDKEWMEVKYEIWENGQLKSNTNLIKTHLKNGFNGEVSISLRDINLDNSEPSQSSIMTIVISDQSGYSSSSQNVEKYPKFYGSSPFNLQKEFKTSVDQELSIWGLMATDIEKTQGYHEESTIEATAKKVDWALVIKINFYDKNM